MHWYCLPLNDQYEVVQPILDGPPLQPPLEPLHLLLLFLEMTEKTTYFFNDHLPSFNVQLFQLYLDTVWPDWAIYWTLGKFLKPLAPINLPKSPTFLGIFGKGGKIYRFSSVIIFGQLFRHLAIFFWSPCLDSFCIPTWYGTWSWAYIVDGDGSYWSKWQTVACKIPKLIIYPRNFQVLQL